MPYGYRRYRRSYSRRPTKSRYRNNYTRRYFKAKWSKRPPGSGAQGKRFFKIKYVFKLTADENGEINLAPNTNSCFGDSPVLFQDWTNIQPLFDSFRVAGNRINYIPSAPNDESNMSLYAPLYIAGDPNDPQAITGGVNQIIQYENLKTKNLYRPWKYWYRYPRATAYWKFNQFTDAVTLAGGYRNSATDTNPYRGIKLYAEDLTPGINYGTMVITLYMVCKNRV